MGALPAKLFFRIGEVAGLVGVEPHVLRYWEREFRTIRPTKSAKGQRVYSRKDVENLLRVRDLLYRDGFTIAGAKKKLQRGPETDALDESEAIEVEVETSVEIAAAAPAAIARVAPIPEAPSTEPTLLEDAEGTLRVREKLNALRSEVETFLEELTETGRAP